MIDYIDIKVSFLSLPPIFGVIARFDFFQLLLSVVSYLLLVFMFLVLASFQSEYFEAIHFGNIDVLT